MTEPSSIKEEATAAAAVAAVVPVLTVKKVKKVVEKPVPPPAVTTAYVVLRGAVAGVVGASLKDVTVSVSFQPTFQKDAPKLTGKFGVNLGKKTGTLCAMFIPHDDNGVQTTLFLDKIEAAANAIIQQDRAIHVVPYTYQKDNSSSNDNNWVGFGSCALDGSELKKAKEGDTFKVAIVDNLVLSTFPGANLGSTVYTSTGHLKSIKLDRSPIGCTIISGPKSKKCDISLKFEVEIAEHAQGEDFNLKGENPCLVDCSPEALRSQDTASLMPSKEKWAKLLEQQIRLPEGLEYVKETKDNPVPAPSPAAPSATIQKIKVEEVADAKETACDIMKEEDEMVVNAWEVKGIIDYDKLVNEFGSKLIDSDLIQRFESLTVGRGTVPSLHRFLRRNIFFSHRDLDRICHCLEHNLPVYLYTGRGPSSGSMHLGHLIPFEFTQWLQQALQCPLVIQMTDDEKFLFKGEYTDDDGDNLDWYQGLTMENAKDILSCGFLKDKTFVFSDLDYVGTMYPNICRIWKAVTSNNVNNIFGFDGTANIGKIAFPAIQAAPSFSSSFPLVLHGQQSGGSTSASTPSELMTCLIPCAIDQDPYFRMTRDVAHKLVPRAQFKKKDKRGGHPTGGKPALIHSKFFPPLQGAKGKMSASESNSAVFLTDSQKVISDKIHKFAFSGGQNTKALQQEKGADLDQDVAYQWLTFFLDDDELLKQIGDDYSTGTGEYWSTSVVKTKLVDVLQKLVAQHQERRSKVTEDIVREWMTPRPLLP
jgi:tryptophanyl-tRNA synthetase